MLKIFDIEFKVLDSYPDRELLGFDLNINPILFELQFYDEYKKSLNSSELVPYEHDGVKGSGRLGQLIYDPSGNIRLWINTEDTPPDDEPDYVTPMQYNLRKLVEQQEKNINSIIDVLEKNNLIDDTAAFEHYLPKHKNGVDMGRKVPDLFDYLKDTGQTFEYLREHPLDLD